MRRLIPLLVLILVIFAGIPFVFRSTSQSPQQLANLPWKIEALPDGTSRIFGITLGRDTLDDARQQLGEDMELAIIVFPGEAGGGLEMFYSRYRAGMLTGKLVVAADVDPDTLAQMRERSVRAQILPSTARKFSLDADDLPLAWQSRVKGVTFVPAANIDEATALKRFGKPAQVITRETGETHWLYPQKGLDLILNESGKDVLQYVAPREFAALGDPLHGVVPDGGSAP